MEDLARLVPRLLGGGGGGGSGGSAVAYIASKRHYFGVGGGTTEFRQALLASAAAGDVAGDEPHAAAAPTLEITSEAEMEDGCSNVREILSVRAEVGATGAPRPPFAPDLTEVYVRFATPQVCAWFVPAACQSHPFLPAGRRTTSGIAGGELAWPSHPRVVTTWGTIQHKLGYYTTRWR
eukprot:COSAG01_NODE_7611_length_3127_cov_51.853038_3_plen_179_part_00